MQESNNEQKDVQKDETKVDKVVTEKEGLAESIEVVEAEEVVDNSTQEADIEKSTTDVVNNFPTNSMQTVNPFSVATTQEASFAVIKETANSMEYMLTIANQLVSSKLCPLKTPSDVVVAIITGNQYGFHFMTSVNQIFPINGKPTMSIHLQRALLLKHKVLFKKELDYEPIYEFGKLNADGATFATVEVDNGQGGKIKVPVERYKGIIADKRPTHGIIKEVDRITKYTFTRLMKLEDGSYEKLSVTCEYKMSDAATAGLLDKDNWRNHPPRMLDARAFGIGAKEIASDILLGVYAVNELADEYNVKYTINSSGEEVVVVDEN